MSEATDVTLMRRALRLAGKGWGQTAPNPMVGAVVADGQGHVVGEGYHARFGEDHAEVVALNRAGERARGGTLYVNLEPCNHQGKTPPCTRAIVNAGIARVVVATRDPNPAAAGGLDLLASSGVALLTGLEEARARELNAAFLSRFSSNRPWTILKLAMSLDGFIADHSRSRGWLTSGASRRAVHHMRAGVDAIAVGMGTVLADDPSLTPRGRIRPRVPPVRIVFSRSGGLPAGARLATTADRTPTWLVVVGPVAPEVLQLKQRGVKVLPASGLGDAMRLLASEGITSVLVEGGGELAGGLLDAELVDRLTIFRAPILLGGAGVPAFAGLRGKALADTIRLPIVESRLLDGDQMTTYALTHI